MSRQQRGPDPRPDLRSGPAGGRGSPQRGPQYPPGPGDLGAAARERRFDFPWIVGFLGAAVVGGLAAADIVHERQIVAVLLGLLVGLVFVVILVQGVLDPDPVAPPSPGDVGMERPEAPQASFTPRIEHGPTLPVIPPPVRDVPSKPPPVTSPPDRAGRPPELPPVTSPPDRDSWWKNGQGAPGSAPASPAQREPGVLAGGPAPQQQVWMAPAVPERHAASEALIAQCPNCGSFQVAGRRHRSDWSLGCRECTHEWMWREGGPWPPVQVRPEIRGLSD